MRIGIFTDTYPPFINGVSTSIYVLQKSLEKKGHDVFVVTVNTKKMEYEIEDKIIKIPGIPTGIYDYRLTGIYPIRVINKIKKWNLDVIHSHTEFGVGTFARIISKQMEIPLVHTYHTMYEDYVHYITKGFFLGTSQKIVQYLTNFYCDKTATELIVPTEKTYALFKEKYSYARSVHIVPTGIPLDKYYKENYDSNEVDELKEKLGIKYNDFVILFVGRISKEKNIEFLINGHHDLIKKNSKIKLLIVGDGPDLEKMKTNTKNIKEKIIFTGKVPYEKIGLYYQLANVFTTASNTETQGLTVIEALAASLPIVVLEDAAFKTAILEKINGYSFKNEKEYIKIMLDLVDDKEKMKDLIVQARNSAEIHSDKYFADRILAVYESAIKKIPLRKKTFFSRFKKVVEKSINE